MTEKILSEWQSGRGLTAKASLCSRNAHDETVLVSIKCLFFFFF